MDEMDERSGAKDLAGKIEKFIEDLKQSNVQGSYLVATNTLLLLRQLIDETEWKTTGELMKTIIENGRRMIDAQPVETAIANMIRRVLKIIREECTRAVKGQPVESDQDASLQKLLLAEGATDVQAKEDYPNINAAELIEAIDELMTELETSPENIAAQALEHIHANEIILTAGKSRTVEAFLKKAAKKKRKFQVIVVEGAPFYHGHELAMSLAKDNIETTVITDTAVFAMMSRVNKVIIGTHTVMANGGLKAFCGSHTIALAAKFYSVPVIVCAAMFKISPQYVTNSDQPGFNKFVSPQAVLPSIDGDLITKIRAYNSIFDYVPPELVTLFISNMGGHAPFYIYRLLSELYSSEDHDLYAEDQI